MTTALVRSALAAVCAAITDGEVCDVLSITWGRRVVYRWAPDRARRETVAWTVDTPRDAFERLTLRDVLPVSWADDSSRAFWCANCRGRTGVPSNLCRTDGPCDGTTPTPQTMPDLVAWSSLGAETIVAAEELARETARRLRPWGVATRDRRCVWKVATIDTEGWAMGETPTGWPLVGDRPEALQRGHGAVAWERAWRGTGKRGAPFRWWAAHVEAWPKDDPRPCPHEPVLALLRMGLALDALTDDALVLVVPPL